MKVQHKTFVFLSFFSAAFCDGSALANPETLAIRVKKGENITFGCSQANFQLTFTKVSFCREPCRNEDTLVNTTGGQAWMGRYSIKLGKGGVIYVSITNVSKSDSGLYACTIDRRFLLDVKETFKIQVEEGKDL